MDRQTIEAQDEEVVKKFRSVVEGMEHRKQKNIRIKKIAFLLTACCVICLIVFIYFPGKKLNYNSQPGFKTKEVKNITINDKIKVQKAQSENNLPPNQMPVSDVKIKTDNNLAKAGGIEISAKVPIDLKREKKAIKPDSAILQNKIITAKATAKKPLPIGINITKIVTCQNVEDRQIISPQKEFSIQKNSRVYVWMKVNSKQIPYTLNHIYFINDRKYCTVPLSVTYPHMRTWSYITLNNDNDVGRWRVDVVTEKGKTVSQIEFSVVP